MCLNRGNIAARLAIAAVLGLVLSAVIGDSPARAGFLKNSVRVGDRTAMTILRPPKPGHRRLPGRSRGAGRGAAHGWFWKQHDTDSAAGGPARWAEALTSMRAHRAGGGALFSESRLRGIAGMFETQIASAARQHNLSEVFVLAVIAVESAGQANAVSSKGAQGLMQLIPATARRFGVADSFDPAQNILGGAAYLDWLLDNFGGDVILALAGYNAGEAAVARHHGVPPYNETRDYVVKVLDALAAAEGLCGTPPDSPRRACGWPSAPPS